MEGGGHQLIESLYFTLLDSWNKMDAGKFASLFSEDGNVVGFDGSAANGKDEIEQHLSAIFSNHKVATYVGIVREVRFLTPEVAVLRAVAGMVPPGQNKILTKNNAVQTMVAQNIDGELRIVLYQNTPAAYDGRPEESAKLTNELEAKL